MPRAVRELTLRAVPIWVLRQYLEQLGAVDSKPPPPGPTDPDAVVTPDGAMSGDGWTVLWRTEQRPMHPRLPTKMDEHYFVFTAETEEALEALIDRFMLKAQRGGG
ncbi:MAG: hypothetical protein F4038_12810 [Chloroflexi bacterium]|nr:hypothetical protein [Chloroflexota bacterium]MCY3589970.1 hypothetical protein [Chloroflexota bacterium]MCY3684681.1 hypothetical protein [Chloroflexota bacterium]MDE2708070.1 hypothetical protein [Chloroflexota bacterium]MYA02846.1 hypothetical protein [Chloroflexota bacterium]